MIILALKMENIDFVIFYDFTPDDRKLGSVTETKLTGVFFICVFVSIKIGEKIQNAKIAKIRLQCITLNNASRFTTLNMSFVSMFIGEEAAALSPLKSHI